MIVEFFGVPGSGKSTLAHAAAQRLRAEGIAVHEPTFSVDRASPAVRISRKAAQAIHYSVTNPQTSVAMALRLRRSGQPDTSTLLRCLANWLMIRHTINRAPPRGVTFLDQGVAQAIWSIGLWARYPGWLSDAMDAVDFGPLDAIVHVTAPMTVVEARLSRRTADSSRLNRAALQTIRYAESLADDVVRRFSERGAVIHNIVSTDASVGPRADSLASVILEALREEPHATTPGHLHVTASRHAGARS